MSPRVSQPAERLWESERAGLRNPAGGMLFLLAALMALNILDRQILAVLAEPIKRDLGLSDLQVGLLTGFAFSIVYSTSGIGLAWLADRGNRAKIIALSAAAWCAMTGACGVVTTFPALLAARAGVAVGEAGFMPAANSLLADYYPPNRRAFALAILQVGGIVGAAVALMFGGLAAQTFGWRAPLIAIAALGSILAVITWFCLREPRLSTPGADRRIRQQETLPFGAAMRSLLTQPAYCWLLVGGSAAGFGMYSLLNWTPSFFQRVYGWSMAEAGVKLSLALGAAGIASALMSGRLADGQILKDPGAHCRIPAVMMLLATPLVLAFLQVPWAALSLAALTLVHLLSNAWQPGTFAAIQSMADSRTRALASAIAALAINFVGLGLGPVVVGAISDALHSGHGDQSLRYALLPTVCAYLISAAAYSAAAKGLRRQHQNRNA